MSTNRHAHISQCALLHTYSHTHMCFFLSHIIVQQLGYQKYLFWHSTPDVVLFSELITRAKPEIHLFHERQRSQFIVSLEKRVLWFSIFLSGHFSKLNQGEIQRYSSGVQFVCICIHRIMSGWRWFKETQFSLIQKQNPK